MNNLNHPFDFLRRDRPGATLLPQQVHYVSGEFVTSLKQTKAERSILLSFNYTEGNVSNCRKFNNQLEMELFRDKFEYTANYQHDERQRIKMSKRCKESTVTRA